MRTQDLFNWIKARHDIYLKRQRGEPKPWTADPILREWRFCNVYRELDTVTIWIRKNWREPHVNDPDLWFAMCVARLVNWPETLADLGYPVPWDAEKFRDILYARKHRGEKVYTGAYLISPGPEGISKELYLARDVLSPLWGQREHIRKKPVNLRSLAVLHAGLIRFRGLGSFMAAQVIADLKYVEPLRSADDWWSWAASGPGSKRGLNRVLGREVNAPWKEYVWLSELQRLQQEINPLIVQQGMERLHAQDLQNCLCEWDKYERVRLNQGQPRARYNGI